MMITKEEKQRRNELFEDGIKVCCRCKRELSFDCFNKNKSTSDGMSRMCRDCSKKVGKKYYEEHSDEMQQRSKLWRENHPERHKEQMRQYRENNKDKIAQYRDNNRDALNKYKRDHWLEYYKRSKDKILQYQAEHQEEIRQQRRRYNQTPARKLLQREYAAKRKACQISNGGNYSLLEVNELLEFFDHKCAYTGQPLEDNYHLDHVVALTKGGTNYIYNIVPCNRGANCSKNNREMESWYRQQKYFSEERLQKIYDWMQLKQKDIKGEENNETRDIEEIASGE